MKPTSNKKQIFNLLTIISIAVWSLISHPWGATPLVGCALFAKKQNNSSSWALWTILPALFNDLFWGFHSTTPWIYGTLLAVACLGASTKKIYAKILAPFFATGLFFAVTNFGVWYTTTLYPLSYKGLIACYAAALPFLPALLISTLVTTSTLYIALHSSVGLTIRQLFCRVIKN